jgi:hypothetical protein
MSVPNNPFEGITFPQYRKYKNGKSYFKILAPDLFEEKRFIGKQLEVRSYKAEIFPDRNFIYDLLLNYSNYADLIGEDEYLSVN